MTNGKNVTKQIEKINKELRLAQANKDKILDELNKDLVSKKTELEEHTKARQTAFDSGDVDLYQTENKLVEKLTGEVCSITHLIDITEKRKTISIARAEELLTELTNEFNKSKTEIYSEVRTQLTTVINLLNQLKEVRSEAIESKETVLVHLRRCYNSTEYSNSIRHSDFDIPETERLLRECSNSLIYKK